MTKATLFERYKAAQQNFHDKHKETMPSAAELWNYQELLYRIEVFEFLVLLKNAAPLSSDMKYLGKHYMVLDAYVENLLKERSFAAASTPEKQKQRETAHASLNSVVNDYRKRYSSYCPQSPEQYEKDIGSTIKAVLPAWVQYRNTINEIKLMEATA
jgi:hypothetical protein